MFGEEIAAMGAAAKAKHDFLESNGWGYFVSSMLAGVCIAFGVFLIFTAGGTFVPASWTRVFMGASFGISLSLAVIAGTEVFNGNILMMAAGVIGKTVTLFQSVRLWLVCLAGNWAGSFLLALLLRGSGLSDGSTAELIASMSAEKTALFPLPLFLRAMLCNTLICLAVWSTFRCRSESGKLLMISWCLYCFLACGFENCLTNMSLIAAALLSPGAEAVSPGGYVYNVIVVSLGNMAGAVLFLALPYCLVARARR